MHCTRACFLFWQSGRGRLRRAYITSSMSRNGMHHTYISFAAGCFCYLKHVSSILDIYRCMDLPHCLHIYACLYINKQHLPPSQQQDNTRARQFVIHYYYFWLAVAVHMYICHMPPCILSCVGVGSGVYLLPYCHDACPPPLSSHAASSRTPIPKCARQAETH